VDACLRSTRRYRVRNPIFGLRRSSTALSVVVPGRGRTEYRYDRGESEWSLPGEQVALTSDYEIPIEGK